MLAPSAGHYQPEFGATKCRSCQGGKTTTVLGATSEGDCVCMTGRPECCHSLFLFFSLNAFLLRPQSPEGICGMARSACLARRAWIVLGATPSRCSCRDFGWSIPTSRASATFRCSLAATPRDVQPVSLDSVMLGAPGAPVPIAFVAMPPMWTAPASPATLCLCGPSSCFRL